jgi:YidC/Oxa1 family membrane protein insertase
MGAITNFMKIILEWINSGVHNYGWSIVIFTVVFRFVLLPLDIKSKVDMRKYQKQINKLKPKLDEINRKFANDPQKKQAKTAELYKQENVSMLGGCKGCIPILLQYPLLIAFFAVFRDLASSFATEVSGITDHAWYVSYAAEKGWNFLWINNIWQPDIAINLLGSKVKDIILPNGYFILPLLAGVTQFVAAMIQPKNEMANEQQGSMKMMQIVLPLMFVYFTLISSAALALYWVVSNIIAVASQFFVNKYLDMKDKKAEQASQGGNVDYEIR